jgi:hypothetical protein
MKLFRTKIKAAVLALCAVAAVTTIVSVAGTGNAYAGTTAVRPALTACGGGVGGNYFHYYEPTGYRGLDLWDNGFNKNVTLGKVSGSTYRDCFKILGGFGDGRLELQAWQTDFCLSIKGPSTAQGADVILYWCKSLKSELFTVIGNGSHPYAYKSAYSNKCLDLSNGFKVGSTLVQKACKTGDLYQGWYDAS